MKLLHLHPSQTVYTKISRQRLLCPSHYLHIENFTSGLNLAAKHWPEFTKHTLKTNPLMCIFVKTLHLLPFFFSINIELACIFNTAKLIKIFHTLDHYTRSPECLRIYTTNASCKVPAQCTHADWTSAATKTAALQNCTDQLS